MSRYYLVFPQAVLFLRVYSVGSLCSVPPACQTFVDQSSLKIWKQALQPSSPGRPPGTQSLVKNAVALALSQPSLLPFSVPPGHPLWPPWMRQPIQSCWAPENRKIIGALNFDLCCCHSNKQARRAPRPWALCCLKQAGGLLSVRWVCLSG